MSFQGLKLPRAQSIEGRLHYELARTRGGCRNSAYLGRQIHNPRSSSNRSKVNKAEDALPVGWGRLDCPVEPCRVNLFFESSSPLWNWKWNLPCNLKSQLCFSCPSPERAWWELADMGPGSPGETSLPFGTCRKVPQAVPKLLGLRLKWNISQGAHHRRPLPVHL